MNKLILLLSALLYMPIAFAEPALLKEIKLEPINSIFVDANIELTLIQSDEYKAEIIVRQASTSDLKLGVEKQQLVIKEELPNQFSPPEPISMAKVTVYAPNIESIRLQQVTTFTASNLMLENLQIYATKHAVLNLNDSTIKKLKIYIKHNARFIGNNLRLPRFIVDQSGSSSISVKNSKSKNTFIKSRNKAQISLQDTQIKNLNLSIKNFAQADFLNHNTIGSAELETKNSAKINAISSQFKNITVKSKNNSNVKLGKAESIDIIAKNNAHIFLYPTKNLTITKTKSVKINIYKTIKNDIHHEDGRTEEQTINVEGVNE